MFRAGESDLALHLSQDSVFLPDCLFFVFRAGLLCHCDLIFCFVLYSLYRPRQCSICIVSDQVRAG